MLGYLQCTYPLLHRRLCLHEVFSTFCCSASLQSVDISSLLLYSLPTILYSVVYFHKIFMVGVVCVCVCVYISMNVKRKTVATSFILLNLNFGADCWFLVA